jgi:hypothetical protein
MAYRFASLRNGDTHVRAPQCMEMLVKSIVGRTTSSPTTRDLDLPAHHILPGDQYGVIFLLKLFPELQVREAVVHRRLVRQYQGLAPAVEIEKHAPLPELLAEEL